MPDGTAPPLSPLERQAAHEAHSDLSVSIPLRVSVVVPCRNEVSHIGAFMDSVLAQEDPGGGLEVIVADGMSEDGTRDLLHSKADQHSGLRIIDNPGRIVSTGLNDAIRVARGEIIVRMDAHTEYAPDYIRRCVEALHRTGAANVGGPWRAKGESYMQRAIALAFQSPLSSGGAASHRVDFEGPVDSVYLGCWRKETLERLGGFDDELVRNQDDELNLRLTRSGKTVWQSPGIRSWYHPRGSLRALGRQYGQYGYWKVRVIQKHKLPASWRHVMPGAFVGVLLLLAAASPWSYAARWCLGSLLTLYVGAEVLASLIICARPRAWHLLPVMPFVLAVFHLGYGCGFLSGVVDFAFRRRPGSQSDGGARSGHS